MGLLEILAGIGFHFFGRPWPCLLQLGTLLPPPPSACACLCVCLSLTGEQNEADSGAAQSQHTDLHRFSYAHFLNWKVQPTQGLWTLRKVGSGLLWGRGETILSSHSAPLTKRADSGGEKKKEKKKTPRSGSRIHSLWHLSSVVVHRGTNVLETGDTNPEQDPNKHYQREKSQKTPGQCSFRGVWG